MVLVLFGDTHELHREVGVPANPVTGGCEKIDFAEISSEPKCMPKAQPFSGTGRNVTLSTTNILISERSACPLKVHHVGGSPSPYLPSEIPPSA
jgi:hypothetical protein